MCYNIGVMKAFFSKRHQDALFEKKLKVSIPSDCRGSIVRILEAYSDYDGHGNNITFSGAEQDLETCLGHTLKAFNADDKYLPAVFREVIIGGYPVHVLDAIEAWFYQKPEEGQTCEKELNDVLRIQRSPWRVIYSDVVLIDSEYLNSELRYKTVQLLQDNQAVGALEEFQEAIDDLTSGQTKDAVHKAHKSVESVMKTVLDTKELLKPGELLRRFIDSEIVPKYYDDFLIQFEQLCYSITKERNLPGRGHGQGKELAVVPQCLAEFAVNLAGSVNVFILKHWIELKQANSPEKSEEDIPF